MITLRPTYQRPAVDSINKFFRNGYGNPLIVAPTGSGKSMMIAAHTSESIKAYPNTRMMVLAHVGELLQQGYDALKAYDPELDVGLYSAGLNRRDKFNSVIVAGIQSVYDKADTFGFIDMCIVDECDLINPKAEGMYRDFLAGLKRKNPALKVIGFTATPYRLGHGYIHKGEHAMFDGIAYDIPVEQLIDEGFLVKPVCKSGAVHADLSNVHITRGEFKESEAEEAFMQITLPAVKDILEKSKGRAAGLVFCSGVKHAHDVKRAFESFGEYSVQVVTGKTDKKERKQAVRNLKEGRLKWILNVGIFTVGFDAPNLDVIAILRATQSTRLYVQILGRPLRLIDSAIGHLPSKSERLLAIASSLKPDALVLDYGENVKRHGPLNCLTIKEPGQKQPKDQVNAKDCPKCEILIPVNARICPMCGYVFPIEERGINHATTAAEADLLVSKEAQWVPVEKVVYKKYTSKKKRNSGKATPTMKVEYHTGPGQVIPSWVCFDHDAYAHTKALHWAKARGIDAVGLTVDDALDIEWPAPKRIRIIKNVSGYYDIKEYDFSNNKEEK